MPKLSLLKRSLATAAITLLSGASVAIPAQIVLNFPTPFRLKNTHWFDSKDGFAESFRVGGEGSLYIRTINGGEVRKISDSDLSSLFLIDDRTGFVVGTGGEILLTEDRGKTWIRQESGTKIDLEKVFCVDRDKCWIVGYDDGLLLRGGANGKWKQSNIVSGGSFHDIWFANSKVGYAVGRDGLFLKTQDGGETWVRINIPTRMEVSTFIDGVAIFEAVVFDTTERGCAAGWDIGTGIVACTQDGGHTWNINYLKAHPIGLIWGKKNQIFLVDEYGENLTSRDLGKTWTAWN